MSARSVIGGIGSFMLLVGAFLPFVFVPNLEAHSLLSVSSVDGVLVSAMGIGGLAAIANGQSRWIPAFGLIGLLVTGWGMARFSMAVDNIRNVRGVPVDGGPFSTVAENTMGAGEFGWGAALLIAGSLAMLVSGLKVGRLEHNKEE